MKDAVYLDSGAFIAFLVRSDRLHEEAVALFARPPRHWCTSVLVVAETYGWKSGASIGCGGRINIWP